jgi:hypothetical protein
VRLGAAQARILPEGKGPHLVFLGTLYHGIRNPLPLLHLVFNKGLQERMPDLQMHFFGDINDCASCFGQFSERLGSSLHLHGLVSHQQALQVMSEADVLVNLGNATDYQLPSKVLEYAALGKPILNFASSRQDSTRQLLSTYPAAMSLQSGSAPSKSELDSVAEFLARTGAIDPLVLQKWLRPFKVEQIARSYLAAAGLEKQP